MTSSQIKFNLEFIKRDVDWCKQTLGIQIHLLLYLFSKEEICFII